MNVSCVATYIHANIRACFMLTRQPKINSLNSTHSTMHVCFKLMI